MHPVGGHAVGRGHGTQCDAALVGSLVAHHADALHGEQDSPRLPHLVVKPGIAQGVDVDFVHVLQDSDLFGRDVAQDTDRKAGPREGMAPDELLGDPERPTDTAHLVLEEQAQRFDDPEVHLFGQPADVVVRLDRRRGAVDRHRLDHVGIDCPLCQPAHVLDPDRLLVEYLDEIAADDLALGLGIAHAGQVTQELVAGLHTLDVQAHVLIRLEHVLEFVLAQQARIHEDAVEVLADGPVQQHGGHRRVDAARKPEHDLVVAQFLLQLAHGGLYETLRGPLLPAAADTHDEILQQVRAVGRMVNLGVELDAPGLLALDAERSHAHLLGAGHDLVVSRHGRDRIAVRHPHLRGRRQAAHQRVTGIAHRKHRTAVLAAGRRLHLAAEGRCEELCAVADPQQGQFALDGRKVGGRGMLVPHGEGTAREDHAPHRSIRHRNLVEGVDLAIDIQFAYAPCDELRILRPEVENQDFFHNIT